MRLAFVALIAFTAACAPTAEPPRAPEPAPPAATAAAPAPTVLWTVTDGISAPESMYVDPQSGVIFASLVVGQPTERDGKGGIAKLNPDGTLVSSTWVTGLNAPKGLRSHGGTLWVSDIDQLVSIDIASGKILSRLTIAGAQFLNDVAIASDGRVFVSDMLASRIYVVKDGQASVFAEGDDLEHPNGLLVEGHRLIVGAWGKPEADFSTKVPGRLYALDLTTKAKTLITPTPTGNLDGLESDGKGGYIVSDWNAGTVRHITADGRSRVILTLAAGTADLGFLPASGTLLLPQMNEHKLLAYNIASDLK